MKMSERTLRISAATLLALLMVGTSYVLSGPSFLSSRFASAETSEELLKAYASKDTDGDELPDWQEALYGTDPNKAISNTFGIPDGQAVQEGKLNPNTLASQLPSSQEGTTTTADLLASIPVPDAAPGSITEQFSHDFFQQYIETSGGQPLSADQEQKLLASLLANFQQRAAKSLASTYTTVSLRHDPSVSATAYAGTVEDVLDAAIPDAPNSDILVLSQKVIQDDDSAARARLLELSGEYSNAVTQLLLVPTPPALIDSHLRLVRALDVVSRSSKSIANLEKDPVLTMGAISTLSPSRDDIMLSLTNIAEAVLVYGEPAAGAPGKRIVDAVRREQSKTQQ
jgi:hypothetical protein